jgi:P-type E1-E2 ATPase
VDQSPITGESMPVDKEPGAQVYAGTINQSGALEVRVTGIGKDTAFGKIVEAVERADKLRAPIQKTADRLAGYLVYFALACAILTFVLSLALHRDFHTTIRATISVVIVAGACGIAAGTPLAILGAIGVGLAAFGLLNPLVAALIHVVSELAFILNSARLLPAVSHDRSAAAEALSGEAIAASGVAEPAVS